MSKINNHISLISYLAIFLLSSYLKRACCTGNNNNNNNNEEIIERLPNALIIGSPKCGTTALLRLLALHPDVAVAHGNADHEVNYFIYNYKYKRGLAWYASTFMPNNSAQKYTRVEKSLYFDKSPSIVPDRIHAYNSSIKLILLVRNPVARTISDMCHQPSIDGHRTFRKLFPEWGTHDPTFHEVFGISSSSKLKKKASRYKHFLLRRSLYYISMKRWLQFFPLNQFLVLESEELVQNPIKSLNTTLAYLGLDIQPILDNTNFYFNQTKGFYCWKAKRNELSNGQGQRKQQTNGCLPAVKGRVHPKLPEHDLKRLGKYFREYNLKFFKLIGQSFEWNNKY